MSRNETALPLTRAFLTYYAGFKSIPAAENAKEALAELDDEREMTKQAIETLEDIRANWRRIIDESDPDGFPLIENLLYSAIDDLGGNS